MGTYSPRRPPHRVQPSPLRHKPQPHASRQQPSLPNRIPQWPKARSPRRGWQIAGAIALLLGTGAGVMGLGWLSLQLIVKPQSLQPRMEWLPGWQTTQTTPEAIQTLTEIRSELQRQGVRSGELLNLGKNQSILEAKSTTTEWLMPVLETRSNCFSDCDRLVELRVYQQTLDRPKTPEAKEQYVLITQLPLAGLEESFAIAPLVDATSNNQGSSRNLPFTQLQRFEGTVPTPGLWFNASGHRTRGDEAIAYGQIIYYHPNTHHLSVKLSWTSPAAELPVWKNVTGSHLPELVINQTVGMEPQFEIYQVKSQRFVYSPIQLEPISLSIAHIDESHYQSALWLARNRLWSTSLTWLKALKARSPKAWSEPVQAQMDLIQWHAQSTETQAESSWASPSQQILANLLDGRWERATTIFTRSLEASQETVGLLKADQGRLENRVKAALRVSPRKFEVKAWGALLIAAQQTPQHAIAWLQKQPQTSPADILRIQGFMQRLDPNFEPVQPRATPLVSPTPTPSSTPLAKPEPAHSEPTLPPPQ